TRATIASRSRPAIALRPVAKARTFTVGAHANGAARTTAWRIGPAARRSATASPAASVTAEVSPTLAAAAFFFLVVHNPRLATRPRFGPAFFFLSDASGFFLPPAIGFGDGLGLGLAAFLVGARNLDRGFARLEFSLGERGFLDGFLGGGRRRGRGRLLRL